MILNALYLLASVLFVALVFIQVLRTPPPPGRRANWPLRTLWVGERLRHAALALFAVSALLEVFVIVGGGIGMDRAAYEPALLAGALALTALGLAAVLYSVLLYWVPSPAEPDGF